MPFLIVLLAILGSAAGLGSFIIKNLYYVCQPNEILIFAGSKQRSGDRELGYRLIKGGNSIRTPLLEKSHAHEPNQYDY